MPPTARRPDGGGRVVADLTADGVAALAPDAKVAAAGKKLGAPKSWQNLGCSSEAALATLCAGETEKLDLIRTRLEIGEKLGEVPA
ncbi:MAG: hypothetical protein H0V83_08585 [Rubrobacter sp.]|nr:hypothetical protein [Rubrobacter sp.]